jgi:hypothetical protein
MRIPRFWPAQTHKQLLRQTSIIGMNSAAVNSTNGSQVSACRDSTPSILSTRDISHASYAFMQTAGRVCVEHLASCDNRIHVKYHSGVMRSHDKSYLSVDRRQANEYPPSTRLTRDCFSIGILTVVTRSTGLADWRDNVSYTPYATAEYSSTRQHY